MSGSAQRAVPGMASTASALKRATTSGQHHHLVSSAALSLSITAAGVPAAGGPGKVVEHVKSLEARFGHAGHLGQGR